jgi:hypothetical protein
VAKEKKQNPELLAKAGLRKKSDIFEFAKAN